MADNNIFRVEKRTDFTVMSNHHFKNKNLSLKAKGLLSLMLSLPENWDYSLSGLVKICMEGKDAINKALNELEDQGYLVRKRIRGNRGRFIRTEYIIREIPISPHTENPVVDKSKGKSPQSDHFPPHADNPEVVKAKTISPQPDYPDTVNPDTDYPDTENPPQSSTKEIKELKELITNQSIYSAENLEINEDEKIEDVLCENIEYDVLTQDPDYFGNSNGTELLDSIVEIMKEPFAGIKATYRIGGAETPADIVCRQLLKLECEHIKYVYDCVFGKTETTGKIKNMKAYLLTALYNAPVTYAAYCAELCRNAG